MLTFLRGAVTENNAPTRFSEADVLPALQTLMPLVAGLLVSAIRHQHVEDASTSVVLLKEKTIAHHRGLKLTPRTRDIG